ncbi:TPA: hypothetical protein HA241_03635 [Candidatus Woesearchaeota archaeon]|nr:hypothetical protein [Candidatus Woesearchaeota archaeon]
MFERKLFSNIRRQTPFKEILVSQGRYIVSFQPDHFSLRRVFGIASYSLAVRCNKEMDEIKSVALRLLQGRKGMFKIETNRADKSFPLNSLEINRELGSFLENNCLCLVVDLRNPTFVFSVEINQQGVFMFTETIPCFGGVPTGVEGSVALLLDGEASVLAGLLVMKRGCDIFPVRVGCEAENISFLQQFSPAPLHSLSFIDFPSLQQWLFHKKINFLVNGQTFSNFVSNNLIISQLRPLVAYNKIAIQEQLTEYHKAANFQSI